MNTASACHFFYIRLSIWQTYINHSFLLCLGNLYIYFISVFSNTTYTYSEHDRWSLKRIISSSRISFMRQLVKLLMIQGATGEVLYFLKKNIKLALYWILNSDSKWHYFQKAYIDTNTNFYIRRPVRVLFFGRCW